LYESLPKHWVKSLIEKYRIKRQAILNSKEPDLINQITRLHRLQFLEFDHQLDKGDFGPVWLQNPKVAQLVVEHLQRFDGQFYRLIGYTIMPNHVHVLLDFSVQNRPEGVSNAPKYRNLDYVMNRIKGASARYINLHLKNTGNTFWQAGSYNRYIRDHRHWEATLNYIIQNPVEAGLCQHWFEHPFTWIREDAHRLAPPLLMERSFFKRKL